MRTTFALLVYYDSYPQLQTLALNHLAISTGLLHILKSDFNYDEDLTAYSRCFPESEYNLARAIAQQVLNHENPFCGLVIITKQTVTWFVEEDKVAQWQDTSDPEYIDLPTAKNSSGE